MSTQTVEYRISKTPGRVAVGIFGVAVVAGIIYAGTKLGSDLAQTHYATIWPYLLLGLALIIALGFEFVNGFHDTANAVATVIYTNSLDPHVAVVWSGVWNLIGVMVSSGTVAFAIVALLPIGLILHAGSAAGFAMVFALLISAIVWNLGTWALGLPASSSHTLIGSVIGVGLANQWIHRATFDGSGVDWSQTISVFEALLISPIAGFVLSALLLLLFKMVAKDKRLYEAPKGLQPPPFWIRVLMIGTCTGVSFAHGSNDGQKGMGLIMLILIGTVPTAYALNHAIGFHQIQDFSAVSDQAAAALSHYMHPSVPVADPRTQVMQFLEKKDATPEAIAAERQLILAIDHEVISYKTWADVPPNQQSNVRNDMYVASEALRIMEKKRQPAFSSADADVIANYRGHLDKASKFIPFWVKLAVALALGLGTMVGWKRIVVTVGERIGKKHLTYAQGVSAMIVAMATILTADGFGLPVSTTHVLSSGVAGTMTANHSGLQWDTIRHIAMAWVFTLPAAAALAGTLFVIFSHFVPA
jgi:PiT family inorganic phosphate transporter